MLVDFLCKEKVASKSQNSLLTPSNKHIILVMFKIGSTCFSGVQKKNKEIVALLIIYNTFLAFSLSLTQGRHSEFEPGKAQYSTPNLFDQSFLIRAY